MSCSCGAHGTPNCIRLVPIFDGLSEDEKAEVASITRAKSVRKGDIIYRAGDETNHLYVIHTGRVKIYRLSGDGKEQVLRVLGPGQFTGELSLFRSASSPEYAEALEPSTMCVLEGVELKALMSKYPSVLWNAMEVLTSRLERAERLIEELNLHSVEHRLARALLALADEGSDDFELRMSKGDFASQLGMSQETLSRKLTMFQERGLIALRGQRGIAIVDRGGLRGL